MMGSLVTTVRYILLTALRDKLFTGLLAGVLLASYISAVMGSTALVETQAATITYAAGSARIILMMGLVVFVCFHIRNAFETKEIDVILSRPISRLSLVIAYWAGFSTVAMLLVIPVVAVVAYLGILQKAGFGIWAISLFCETLLVVALALFSALILRSGVASVMSALGFYVLSRMMGYFIATSKSGLLFHSDTVNYLSKYTLTAISIFVPRLDFFAKTGWLVNSFETAAEWQYFLWQTLIFVPLVLTAAIIDFQRKQF